MPIEIRELVIKATLGEENNKGSRQNDSTHNQQDKDQDLVKNCVEAVLEILRQRMER